MKLGEYQKREVGKQMEDRQIWCSEFFDKYVFKHGEKVQTKFYRNFEKHDGRKWDGTGTYSFKVLTMLLQNAQEETFHERG